MRRIKRFRVGVSWLHLTIFLTAIVVAVAAGTLAGTGFEPAGIIMVIALVIAGYYLWGGFLIDIFQIYEKPEDDK